MRCIAQPRWRALGPLRAVELPASADAPTVVCMHGFGANAQDLLPIGLELDLKRAVRWIFPGGPLSLDYGPDSRGWFPIDGLEAGAEIDVSQLRPPGLDEAVSAAEAMLEGLGQPGCRLILGGFSQGAMMALELALRAKERPLGLFLLSSTLVDEPALKANAGRLAGLKFFQSHATDDPILSYALASRLHKALEQAGLTGELAAFQGGHAVPREIVEGLERYLNSVL